MLVKPYSYSQDGEVYEGNFATIEEVVAYHFNKSKSVDCNNQIDFYAGYGIPPISPLNFFDEHIMDFWEQKTYSHVDYSGEQAEGWLNVGKREMDDLKDLMKGWMDKHDLWPKFYNIEISYIFTVKSGIVTLEKIEDWTKNRMEELNECPHSGIQVGNL